MLAVHRTATGGALVMILVLTVSSPALGESLPEPPPAAPAVISDLDSGDTDAGKPAPQPPTGSEPAPDTEPGAESPAGELPDVPAPEPDSGEAGSDPAPAVPGDAERPPEDPPVADPEPAADPEGAPDSELEAADIPETLPVSGTIVVIAEEAPQLGAAPVSAGGAGEPELGPTPIEPEQVLLATDTGPVLEIDPALVGTSETGALFTGEVVLDEGARVAVAEAIDAERDGAAMAPVDDPAAAETEGEGTVAAEDPPPPTDAEVLVAALADAQATGERLAVGGLVIPGTGPGAAVAPKAHSADVIFYTGGGAPSDGQLTQLVRDAGNYWVAQTGGTVSALNISAVKRSTKYASNRGMRCTAKNLDALWTDAARQFGRTANSYLGSGRHLVVLVDDGCGALAGNAAGRGSYGVMHSGGLSWVDLGARAAAGLPLSAATGMIAHELGHNLGLAHGKSRVCTGSATDSATRNGAAVSPCRDLEYGDPFNVMGIGAWLGDRTPPALSIAQQHALGVTGAGAVREVRPSGGASQTFTLQPGGGSTGLRGLRVQGTVGGQFYVEFRAMSGQDRGLGLRAGSVYETGQTRGEFFTASGVRVLRGDPARNVNGTHRYGSTVVSVRDSQLGSSGLYQTARAGKRATPWNSTVRVVVLSADAKNARVRVDFMPFVDVPYSHKFADEIAWMGTSALSTGIAAKGGLREYRPQDRVTREAMAAFLYRMEAPRSFRPPAVSPFADVPRSHKFYREISWMYQSGLSTGTKQRSGKPKYHPSAHVSREAMAAFLFRLQQPRSSAPRVSPFADVRPGQKFYREITWMSQAGLSTGTKQASGKPRYQPKQGVSREAMAAFLQRLNA